MKLYTLTYDDARPTKQQVNIPTNSDYKIGIKVIGSKDAGKILKMSETTDATILAEAFNLYPQQVTLVGDDGSTISADPELTNGYVTFTLKAGDETNFTKYKVQVKNDTFDGIQYSEVKQGTAPRRTNVTASISCDNPTTIYPSDKLQLIEEDGKMHPSYGNIFYFVVKDLSASTPNHTLSYNMYPYSAENDSEEIVVRKNTFAESYDHSISGYNIAPKFTGEMIGEGYSAAIRYGGTVQGRYYIHFAVIPYENTFDLAVNIFKSQQGDIELQAPEGTATQEWVEDYVSGELEDYATTEYVDNAVSGKVSGSSVGQAPAILSATSVYASDWATLSSTADENTMYVVLPDPVLLTRVKYTTASGYPDWEGDIEGVIKGGGDEEATTQIPNVYNAEEVVIGSNVIGLDEYAFMYCSSLKSVTIGDGVVVITNGALADTGLSSITIPSNVTTIGFEAFRNCKSLTSVTFDGFTKNEVKDLTQGNDSIFGSCFTDNGQPIEKSFTAVCSDGSMTIHFSADWEATITFTDL